jgi:uncharacterized protein (UPF0335 family)
VSGPNGVEGNRLRSLVERIERIEEEIRGLNDDKKDVYAEAKSDGFDVKILREVVRLRKQDQNERVMSAIPCSTSTSTPSRRQRRLRKPPRKLHLSFPLDGRRPRSRVIVDRFQYPARLSMLQMASQRP